MTSSNWISIAAFVAAPFWKWLADAWLAARHTRTNGAEIKRGNEQRGPWIRFLLKAALFTPLISIGAGIQDLVAHVAFGPQLVTKAMVLRVALDVSSIAYGFASYFFISLLKLTRELNEMIGDILATFGRLIEVQSNQADFQKAHYELTKEFAELMKPKKRKSPPLP